MLEELYSPLTEVAAELPLSNCFLFWTLILMVVIELAFVWWMRDYEYVEPVGQYLWDSIVETDF